MYGSTPGVLGATTVTTAAWYLNGWTIAFVIAAIIVAARVVYVLVKKKSRP